MKEFITLKLMKTGGYKVLEPVNSKFYVLYETLEYHFLQSKFSGINLLDWFNDEKKQSRSNESVSIRKQNDIIKIYDISDQFDQEHEGLMIELDSAKCFEMTRENFLEIIHQWEELRVSQLDIILMVIDEDNHVSLETNQKIIKEYQDAGYAFDINK